MKLEYRTYKITNTLMSAIENIVYPYYKMLIRWNNIVYFL